MHITRLLFLVFVIGEVLSDTTENPFKPTLDDIPALVHTPGPWNLSLSEDITKEEPLHFINHFRQELLKLPPLKWDSTLIPAISDDDSSPPKNVTVIFPNEAIINNRQKLFYYVIGNAWNHIATNCLHCADPTKCLVKSDCNESIDIFYDTAQNIGCSIILRKKLPSESPHLLAKLNCKTNPVPSVSHIVIPVANPTTPPNATTTTNGTTPSSQFLNPFLSMEDSEDLSSLDSTSMDSIERLDNNRYNREEYGNYHTANQEWPSLDRRQSKHHHKDKLYSDPSFVAHSEHAPMDYQFPPLHGFSDFDGKHWRTPQINTPMVDVVNTTFNSADTTPINIASTVLPQASSSQQSQNTTAYTQKKRKVIQVPLSRDHFERLISINNEEGQELIQSINISRGAVQKHRLTLPTAKSMSLLTWSDTLAQQAFQKMTDKKTHHYIEVIDLQFIEILPDFASRPRSLKFKDMAIELDLQNLLMWLVKQYFRKFASSGLRCTRNNCRARCRRGHEKQCYAFELIHDNAEEIGCAVKFHKEGGPILHADMSCVLGNVQENEGIVVYKVGDACSGCTHACDKNLRLCLTERQMQNRQDSVKDKTQASNTN